MSFQSNRSAAAAAIITIAAILVPALAGAQAVLRGVLYDDSTGVPLRGGAVVLVNPGNDRPVYHAQADSTGVFNLDIAHAGTYQIAAIHEGYQSILSAPVPFASGDRLTVKIPIAANGNPVHHIGVTEHVSTLAATPARPRSRQETEEQAALSRRRSSGMGIVYDRQKLATMNVSTVGDVLNLTPGVGIDDPSGVQSSAVRMRQNDFQSGLGGSATSGDICHVGWFLDGQRYDRPNSPAAGEGLAYLPIKDVDAIEVYRGISEVPGQYADPDLRCGVIAIWTARQN